MSGKFSKKIHLYVRKLINFLVCELSFLRKILKQNNLFSTKTFLQTLYAFQPICNSSAKCAETVIEFVNLFLFKNMLTSNVEIRAYNQNNLSIFIIRRNM